MISVTFTADVENIVATEHLYQWDNGQKLSISGVGTTADIHFANKKSEKALVITPTVTSGAMEAPIPNSLLAEPYPIIAYVYVPSDDGARTLKTVTIAVEARKQPSDYVIEEDEGVTTLETISQKANEVLQNATNQINTAVSNMNTDYGNFKTTIQSELADMVANTTIPNADTLDGLHANEIACNPNLLDNSDFKINQAGKSVYSEGEKECLDRWVVQADSTGGITVSPLDSGGVRIENTGINVGIKQGICSGVIAEGESYTMSVEIDGTRYSAILNADKNGSVVPYGETPYYSALVYSSAADIWIAYPYIVYTGEYSIELKNAKLELGTIATPFVAPNAVMENVKIKCSSDIGAYNGIHANTANTAGTLATTPTNVCLRNISFGTANPQVTDPNAEGYVAPGALYGQYEEVTT